MVSAGGGSSLCLPLSINQINMRLRDNNKDSFLGHIDQVAERIEEELEAEKMVGSTHNEIRNFQFELLLQVLVHCQAGLSRSPAVIAAFLVLKR